MVAVVKGGKASSKAKAKHPFLESNRPQDGPGRMKPRGMDLTKYVRYPKSVQIQRKKVVLLSRLKTPGAIKQFRDAINKNEATQLFRLLMKYRPETAQVKKERLVNEAKAREEGKEPQSKKPAVVKSGLNHVTDLIEQKKAKLVVIAHDVDPIELVVWLPSLCKKMQVPYCIVKGKARLGTIIHQKTATCLALDNVRKEDQAELDQLIQNFMPQFNEKKLRAW
eukprot:Protomagalhaensia_wolfi_Nauph_80__1112@NODE_1650_length_1418_cov_520_328499_g1279_i0_p1_GENE_NODE_1650_length_1418_cov_520_328499_g1279_i0NODE_1650_length_1418_cov_520_328499_g1279_i0_p1_ORF_typecomplete_len223_score64_06Ribosomal_L7Ae/PF01248_26/4_6e03Ribosomal_L7Ae/PF01248_26/2e25_NODE_1650_length_1418_cov_520_328499_g1279_i06741342